MLDYDVTLVEYQAGRCGPLPEWAKYAMAAKWFGVAPWALAAHEDGEFWKEAGLLLRGIEADAQDKGRKK